MSKKLDDLADEFRPKAFELLARFVESGIDVRIIDTLRTEEEHKHNLAMGVSWVQRSRHQDGMAIDVAPIEVLTLKGWAPQHPTWERMGKIGEALGLRWGGRWQNKDCAHFEMVKEHLYTGGQT